MKLSTGLCDSDGNEIFIGDHIRMQTSNKEVHGEWVEYKISNQGMTPILLYSKSEKGQILPEGYTGSILADHYDRKNFIFILDSGSLRPQEFMRKITTPGETGDK